MGVSMMENLLMMNVKTEKEPCHGKTGRNTRAALSKERGMAEVGSPFQEAFHTKAILKQTSMMEWARVNTLMVASTVDSSSVERHGVTESLPTRTEWCCTLANGKMMRLPEGAVSRCYCVPSAGLFIVEETLVPIVSGPSKKY